MIEPAPRAPGQAVSAFQAGDARFDTGPEVTEPAIHPFAFDHIFHTKAALAVERDVTDADGFGLPEVVEAG